MNRPHACLPSCAVCRDPYEDGDRIGEIAWALTCMALALLVIVSFAVLYPGVLLWVAGRMG